ncbi:alpha/beta hydrolase [Nonomuraea sp. K274]|uniref:Alpha/beta hydrolase n=1 Tax=Nonomuraea cypriaca TaxID=1187855 RepID=A0A931EX82_9ACTN|nr:alpha/beta hydrolase [Nonomuraea cypriaca]MBF8185227.1 alpha/beta hydrolase [Nonomuraea cypriaca]
MKTQRTHYVTTTDGVTIGGTVHGQGRPLVFLHGGIGDGDIDWDRLLEHLTGRFTCHLPSMRGRGLSGDHPDLSPGRQVDDVLAYVDSIGGPTGLVGWSAGANLALGAAARSDAVDAVVLVEPPMRGLMDEREQAVIGDAVARMGELAAEGDLTAAVRAFAGGPFNDEEMAVAEEAGYFEAAGRYVPHLLNMLQQVVAYEGPTAEDPAVLGAISAPVLVLHGSDTMPFYHASARHVADHILNARVREIPSAGHAAPLTHPETLAKTFAEFFVAARPSGLVS